MIHVKINKAFSNRSGALSAFRSVMCVFFFFTLSLCSITGCHADNMSPHLESATEEQADNASSIRRIGVSFPTTRLAYRRTMLELVQAAYPAGQASKTGVELVILDADGSQKQQNQDILDLTDMGVDGIVLIPGTMEGCIFAVEYANQNGIPVITVDNRIQTTASARAISFVGSNHSEMGTAAAGLFLSQLEIQKGEKETWNVIHMTGIPDTSGTLDRGEAITDVLESSPRIHLLGSYDGEFTAEYAKSVMEDCLNIFDSIDGVICQNDSMAEGCCEALREAGLAGSMVIVGIDGQPQTLKLIADGELSGTVFQKPTMILDGVSRLLDYLNGIPVEELYYEETYPVSRENVSSYLQERK